jgi:uncharacterized protein YlxP (DUF503 family)
MVLDLYTDSTHSLKDKRHIVSSAKEKLKHKFNISIIESDYQNLWQKIQLSVAMLSNSKSIIEKSFLQIEEFICTTYPVRVLSMEQEFL